MKHRSALVGAVLAVLAVGTTTAGCDSLGGTGDAEFVSQGAGITQIPPADRGAPIDVSGTTLKGDSLDLADLRGGEPVVVNVWGSWCDPCIAEAPKLAQAAGQIPAHFVGIDIRDQTAAALAFNRGNGISYPSIADPDSSTLPAFGRYVAVSPPTTYVLDGQGRLAAVLTGELSSVTTLKDIVAQTAAGK